MRFYKLYTQTVRVVYDLINIYTTSLRVVYDFHFINRSEKICADEVGAQNRSILT